MFRVYESREDIPDPNDVGAQIRADQVPDEVRVQLVFDLH